MRGTRKAKAARTTRGRATRSGGTELVRSRRDQILRCAIGRFAAAGYDNTLLESISDDLGCAKGTLYNYFKNKDEVFTAATDLVMRELIAQTQASESEDPLERIEQGIRAYLRFFDEHPDYVELLIQERAGFPARAGATYYQYRDAHADRWRAEFAALMMSGRVRRMPTDQPFQLIGDLLYGTIFIHRMAGGKEPLAARAEWILDLLYRGLLSESGATTVRTRTRRGKPSSRQGNEEAHDRS